MRSLRLIGLLLLLAVTWVVDVYHLSVYPAPPIGRRVERSEVTKQARFIPREEAGVNQLLVFGTPFERGLMTGRLTAPLLVEEERDLVREMEHFLPNKVLRHALFTFAMRWFWGIQDYLDPRHTDEMYGVAQSAPPEFDYLTDPFTRQVAYHGVHEVGQMFVDFEKQDFGCTLLGVPRSGGWLLGRNFDFEAVRILDTEKIMKWAFPDTGHAYVAVTWAGMVGLVTGVNDQGVYVSINAAGSTDFRRLGTPTTLLALKVLEEAGTPEEAVKIIEGAETFITDLFVVAGAGPGNAYVLEKTPRRTVTTPVPGTFTVANHLRSPVFENDAINRFRMLEQTTVARQERANELAMEMTSMLRTPRTSLEMVQTMVTALRDKRGPLAEHRHLGHRGTLDALIATHSVVYDGEARTLWVSQGPALTGPYYGFDLVRSFAEKRPVAVGSIPADPEVSPETFKSYQDGMRQLKIAKVELAARRCPEAKDAFMKIGESAAREHYEFLMALGDFVKTCENDAVSARTYWRQALNKKPAYLRHRQALEKALQ